MLRSLKEVFGYAIKTKEDEVGSCKDALFDDEKWVVRYLDVDTGHWLPGRRILVSPIGLGEPSWISKTIPTSLSKEQIENSPGLEEDAPVSRQWEERYYLYHNWPHYAAGAYAWGPAAYPNELMKEIYDRESNTRNYDAHLRSAKEVLGYKVHAKDETFGGIQDIIFDAETWSIRYFVIDTLKWLPSKSVLVAPEWVSEIDWTTNSIEFDLTKEEIKNSPAFDGSAPVNKDYEIRLYDYYGRPKYWEKDLHRDANP